MPVELVGATGVAGRATAHVRRAWANREAETLDERGVQGLGILRLPPRRLQPTRRADPPAPFDSDDAIVPPSLEHMTLDARRPTEALTHPNVVLEPIGRDQRESHHASAADDVVEDGRGVSRGAAAEHAPGPQSGTHLAGRTQPCGSALVADERAARISLQLNDFDVAQHPLVEALRRCRGPLEPSREGMAGMARDPGGRRNAHTLDAQARDLVACPTSAAKAAVRCLRVRADRSPADRAAVPPASAPLRRKRAVAHDGAAQCSTVVTPALGAGHPRRSRASLTCPWGEPAVFAQDLGGEGDRSTATGASTERSDDREGLSAGACICSPLAGALAARRVPKRDVSASAACDMLCAESSGASRNQPSPNDDCLGC